MTPKPRKRQATEAQGRGKNEEPAIEKRPRHFAECLWKELPGPHGQKGHCQLSKATPRKEWAFSPSVTR